LQLFDIFGDMSLISAALLAGNVVSLGAMACGFIFMVVLYTRDFSHRDGPVSSVPPWSQWLLALLSPVAFTLAIDQVHFVLYGCSFFSLIKVLFFTTSITWKDCSDKCIEY